MEEENDPEIQARISQVVDHIYEVTRSNEKQFDDQLLRLIGKMSVTFNTLEQDFRYLLILLRDDLPLHEAREKALKIKHVETLLKNARSCFLAKISDPDLQKEFGAIYDEADAVRKQRNLMLHSVWLSSSNSEKPFIRVKEDDKDAVVDFDVPTVERIIKRAAKCSSRAFFFFRDNVAGYLELPAKLHDMQFFISSSR
jgi:hypothetical protein